MGIEAPAKVKYGLIRQALIQDNNLLSISFLCRVANVSRPGYYAWLSAADNRQARELEDEKDFRLIVEAYRFRGYTKGARGIHMRLLHLDEPVRMNLKKIRRLMNKYGLFCPVRKPNPYRQLAKAMRTSSVFPNTVSRNFRREPRKVLLTDITYLFYAEGVCYLSTILDAYTHEILAYALSESLKVDFVISTVENLLSRYGAELDSETIVHSDQGCHYTSKAFIEKLKEADFVQSMSRKGNCWDNAPQESFFGHMKDEIAAQIASCRSFENVRAVLNDWLDYYNKDRYQWELQKLSPAEYYRYTTTGVYPLPLYDKTSRDSAPDPEV